MDVTLVVVALAAAGLAGVLVAGLLGARQAAATEAASEAAVERMAAELRAQAAADRDAAVRTALAEVDALARARSEAELEAGRQSLRAEQALIDQRLDEVRRDVTGRLDAVGNVLAELSRSSQRALGEVDARLQAHAESTASLAASTQGLREALANPKARGQWGERMAEDVLRLAGFVEHVNYEKQRAVPGGRAIPDYTFPLPKGHVLYMDVKFPLAAYLRCLDAGTEAERSAHRDAFLRDVRLRIRELARREYAAAGSLDYVLLFLPNESVIGFVHEVEPALVEEALSAKVVLCSPLTLFAMLGVIRHAFDNFVVEQTAERMLVELGTFAKQWNKFGDAMDVVGRRLESAQRAYEELAGPRRRQLERPLHRLEELRRQRGIPSDEADDEGDGDGTVLELVP
jgi:DNA recombination protein RmuC